jgi:adenine-specific DNA methylase
MLLGLLLPDPADANCPGEFKEQARNLLEKVQGRPGRHDEDLRKQLLRFIGDFANWDLAANPQYLEVSRGLVRAAHGGEPPLVVDPFAGGGSIPLEALRLGCEAFASDLNPVACLILKVMLEDIPRYALDLAEELQRAAKDIKEAADKELAEFYPIDADGAEPVAYLWARTVRCESPHCGAEIPLVRSFWLRNKGKEKYALRYSIVREARSIPRVTFELFSPTDDSEVPPATVSQARARCLCCHAVLPKDRLKAQLRKQRGGANTSFDDKGERTGGAVLLAIATLASGERQRRYRVPTARDYEAVVSSTRKLAEVTAKLSSATSAVPNEFIWTPMGKEYAHGDPYFKFLSVLDYGITKWSDLFTARQQLALVILSDKIRALNANTPSVVRETLALALGKLLRHCNVISKWHRASETVAGAFGMHALPMSWDFPEMYPFCQFAGGYDDSVNDAIGSVSGSGPIGRGAAQVQSGDATSSTLPDDTAAVFFTDPPYYDAIPYADLSDFFFVWHKRTLPDHPLLRDVFDPNNPLSPKAHEIIDNLELLRGADKASAVEEGIPVKDKAHFEDRMCLAFSEGRRTLLDNGVGCIVFAHKTTEGWEALLTGIIRARWVIVGSWPIATERGARLRARESAALASSVHLICRPRSEGASIGDWAEVLRELPNRVDAWMDRLQREGIRGADLVFACIGPALEIFSRYSRVETADGREV